MTVDLYVNWSSYHSVTSIVPIDLHMPIVPIITIYHNGFIESIAIGGNSYTRILPSIDYIH